MSPLATIAKYSVKALVYLLRLPVELNGQFGMIFLKKKVNSNSTVTGNDFEGIEPFSRQKLTLMTAPLRKPYCENNNNGGCPSLNPTLITQQMCSKTHLHFEWLMIMINQGVLMEPNNQTY